MACHNADLVPPGNAANPQRNWSENSGFQPQPDVRIVLKVCGFAHSA